MVPMLQATKNEGSESVGHYYLLVLNLRSNRFERTLPKHKDGHSNYKGQVADAT
jgi:hypothetical protein